MNPLRGIRAFLSISPRLGTAGQPTEEQFVLLAQAGYQTVINLVPAERVLPDEAALVSRCGMEYVHVPIIWTAPSPADLDCFFEAMSARPDQKIFVHCAANMRVSVFVFLWRVLCENVDKADAEDDLHTVWHPEGWWADFIEDALQSKYTEKEEKQ